MAKLFLLEVAVIKNQKVLQFYSKKISRNFKPGQFVTIDCGCHLRRPFSISGVSGNKVEILYKVIGPGTKFLSSRKKGDKINVLGPLGNGFPLPDKKQNVVAVAGGMGIAPILALMRHLRKPGILFYGTKTKNDMYDVSFLFNKGWQVILSTDDGSLGEKGSVLKSLKSFLKNFANRNLLLYSAGPRQMLRELAAVCKKLKLRCYISVEEIIACGVGACRGCVVKVKSDTKCHSDPTVAGEESEFGSYENKTVCKDGPVFNASEIIW